MKTIDALERTDGKGASATALCQALDPLYQLAIELDMPTGWATPILGAPMSEAIKKNTRIPWKDFIEVLSRFGEQLEPHGGWGALEFVMKSAQLGALGRPLSLVFSPGLLYRIIWTWIAPFWFPHLNSTFIEVDESHHRFTLEIPEPYAFDPGYFEITRVMLWELPQMSGYPAPKVTLDIDGRTATFVSTNAPARTVRARVKRRLGSWIASILRSDVEASRALVLDEFARIDDAERRIEATSARRDATLDTTAAAVLELDLETGEGYATPALFELFDAPRGEARDLFSVWADRVIEPHRDRVIEALADLQTASDVLSFETQLTDGRWVRARLSRGGPAFGGMIAGNWVDVSETHIAQAEASRTLQQLEHVLSVAPFGVVVFSRDETFFENPAVQRLPEGAFERITEDLADRTLDGEDDLISLPSPHGGPDVQLRVNAQSLVWEGRKAALATVEDVTQSREMLARSMVMDRMASTGTHAAGIAHEINNPLAYVYTNLELANELLTVAIADGVDVGEVDDVLRDAMEGTKRVRSVVSALKDFSRKGDGERSMTDLHEVVHRSVNLVWAELRGRAELVTRFDIDQPIMADPVSLSQALVALFQNAIRSIPEGEKGRIDVVVTTRGGDAVIEVIDNGQGIPGEIISRVFDPFFTTRPPGEGAGLGLSLSRSRVERMGGQLELYSYPTRGTTAEIRLPLQSSFFPMLVEA